MGTATEGAHGETGGKTMTSRLRKLDTQHDTSLAGAAQSAPDGGFKRLALPAVAAAVQTLAKAKMREPAPQDCSRPQRGGRPS